MNKIIKYSSFIMLLIVLAMLHSSFVSAGCCYIIGTDTCSGLVSQAECLSYGGDSVKYFDESCDDLNECKTVCCCKSTGAVYDSFTACNLGNFNWIETTGNDACTSYCSGDIPACGSSCSENNGDSCIGKGGIKYNPNPSSPFYYCKSNDKTYNKNEHLDCITECSAPAVPDCSKPGSITASCKCEGQERISGYCCTDGRWDSNNTGSGCIEGDCADAGYQCVSGCERGSIYPGYGCSGATPYCCGSEAPARLGCCVLNYEFCSGTVLNDYIYSDCNEPDLDPSTPENIPCSVSCSSLNCSKGNWKINSGVNYDPNIQYCSCDGQYRSTSTDQGYCCDDGSSEGTYQDHPCIYQIGNISGYVYNYTDNLKISGARVDARKDGTIIRTTYSNASGDYILPGLAYDSYQIFASKPGFKINYLDETLNQPMLSGRNIPLTPYSSGPCDSFNPPAPELHALAVKGKRQVNLVWSSECQNINDYIIKRVPEHPLGEIKTNKLALTDANVTWGQTYTYSIRAHYISNAFSDWVSVDITLGSLLCEGVTGSEQFCLNSSMKPGAINIYRYECDENNSLDLIFDCSLNTNNKICKGPDSSGRTSCVSNSTNCKEQGTFEPFGLYYSQNDCESKWCYYDYSPTTIDSCEDCRGKTCYDYQSSETCLRDNCEAGGAYVDGNNQEGYNQGCEWINMSVELGKGLCFDPDFEGQKCSMCNNNTGSIFYNANCNQQICSALGECYSSDNSCFECSEDWGTKTTCDTYNTEESCIGIGAEGHSISFEGGSCGNVPVAITPSNDACGLGICRWNAAAKVCYKDANNDGLDDCSTGDGAEELCRKDTKSPVTMPYDDIPHMNSSGFFINFTVYVGSIGSSPDKFYFCVDRLNNCCPIDIIPISGNRAAINPVDHLTDYVDAGIYYIRYYSVDNYNNTEQVKNLSVYIDRTPPVYSLGYSVEKQTERTSNLTATLSSDEFLSCSYSMLPSVTADNLVIDEFLPGRINKTFNLILNDLNDGIYTLTTTCKDDVNNTNTSSFEILVDAVQQIFNPTPTFDKFNHSTITLSVGTSDNSTCTAQGILGYSGSINLAQTQINQSYFNHTHTSTFSDGTYHFEVTCTPALGVINPDSTSLSFTVDTSLPTTLVNKESAVFDFSGWYKTPLSLSLKCQDVDLGDSPGEFGCNDNEDVKYCLGSFCNPIYNSTSPDVVNIYSSNSISLRYYSVDKGGNRELIKDRTIQIDNIAPVLSNVRPSAGLVLRNDSIRVNGSWSELHIDAINITVIEDSTNNYTIYGAIFNRGASSGIFQKRVDLYNGSNTILVSARDTAGNRREVSAHIFNDIYGPSISGGVFRTDGTKVDSKQIVIPGAGWQNAEYGQSVNFSAAIDDVGGINRSNILVECDASSANLCGSYSQSFDLVKSGDYYTRAISDLSLGRFNITFKVWDQFENYNETQVWFSVNDSSTVTLYLSPDIQDGKTVYLPNLTLNGITNPGVNVDSYVCDENCFSNCISSISSVGGPISTSRQSFKDKNLVDLVEQSFPTQGDTSFIWRGLFTSDVFAGDYLKFSNHNNYYRISSLTPTRLGANWFTKIDITTPLTQNVFGQTDMVSAYQTDKPTGWFELKDITLDVGNNCIVITGTRPATGRSASNIYKHITYINSGLNITQTNPENAEIINSFTDSITIEVTTDFPAFCNLTNEAGNNKVAKPFNFTMSRSSDGMTHYKSIGSGDCASVGGPFCYIQNDGLTSNGVYHRYNVECAPDGLEMNSGEKEICFGVKTWINLGGTESGKNVCDGSTGCGGTLGVFPAACQRACDPTYCVGRQCGDDTCGGTCGTCGAGTCNEATGQCGGTCTPTCNGHTCGGDTCGGSCGTCQSGQTCQSGFCVSGAGGAGTERD